MKYFFQYQGLVKDVAVFTVKVDDQRGLGQMGIDICYYHYKADKDLNIQRVSYMDIDLTKCNTIEHRTDGTVIPARSYLVTEAEAKGLLDTLIERDIVLDGIGRVSEIDFEIIKHYPFEIYFEHKTFYNYYDGENVERALKKAKHNNHAAIDIRLYEGDMAGKLGY